MRNENEPIMEPKIFNWKSGPYPPEYNKVVYICIPTIKTL